MEVVGVLSQAHEFGNGEAAGPLDAKNLRKLFKVLNGCLANREN